MKGRPIGLDDLAPTLQPYLRTPRLTRVDPDRLPRPWPPGLTCTWLSSLYMVQVFASLRGGHVRLSVNRVQGAREVDGRVVWKPGVSWDDLMEIKRAVGYGEAWAVEIYPADEHLVNVANMRHLWILDEAPPYAWVKGERP